MMAANRLQKISSVCMWQWWWFAYALFVFNAILGDFMTPEEEDRYTIRKQISLFLASKITLILVLL